MATTAMMNDFRIALIANGNSIREVELIDLWFANNVRCPNPEEKVDKHFFKTMKQLIIEGKVGVMWDASVQQPSFWSLT